MRQRAALLTHVQQTTPPDNRPEIGQKTADQANRDGGAERGPDPAVQNSIEVDLALIDSDDRLLTHLERDLVQTAKAHEAQTFSRVRSSPGVGQILARVLLDDIHDIHRCPRGQACVSSGRLVTWATASAGTRSGTAGQPMGHASLTWAFSEAAGLCWRNNPAGQTYLARLEKKPGQGKALTGLAHTWARAVYDMLPRDTACDLDKLCQA
jgi:transposase